MLNAVGESESVHKRMRWERWELFFFFRPKTSVSPSVRCLPRTVFMSQWKTNISIFIIMGH